VAPIDGGAGFNGEAAMINWRTSLAGFAPPLFKADVKGLCSMKKIAVVMFAGLGLALAVNPHAQIAVLETDARPDKEIVAEQYLLAGTATRGCGESQVAVNPVNPNQIAVAAMCIVNTNRCKWEQTEEEFTHTPRATITQFVFTRDRGLT
jgi:hypothetical protein